MTVGFCLPDQIFTFIVGIPTEVVDSAKPIVFAYPDFCTKLYFVFILASNNGPNMGLVDVDDPVGTAVCLVLMHLCLLTVNMLYYPIYPLVAFVERFFLMELVQRQIG